MKTIRTFENRELMDKTIQRFRKFEKGCPKIPKKYQDKDKIYSFAYWLFRYSGLEIKEESS